MAVIIKSYYRSVRAAAIYFAFLPLLAAQAQTTGQSSSRLTLQGPAEQSDKPVVRDALGRPCLDVEAAARVHVVNPTLVDHVVSLKNSCPRSISVKVCYLNSDKCNAFDVAPYKRVDTILGTISGIKNFKYVLLQK
ncbi:hypothetical protein QA640_34625 [Bradyrhizobium sp. CB82]|uniref:hypothetical protein n=1 Tax=Bradyrhizobium sp. CB82 TaxID=3039159 RepID=UPI0024B27FA8|nr:hypothetical protein [Bradyrhizobium sp. CB82]WFU39457.1 hypothetical protein QA640_34625 [Bradyrhizobium sp. CB82]